MKFDTFMELAQTIEQIGGRAYFVGGYVRDTLMNVPYKDIDVLVIGLSVDQLVKAIPDIGIVGREYGVFEVNVEGNRVELALGRTEKKVGIGYKGFQVFTDPDVTLYQDLSRRDTTMNAMAIDILTKELHDPFDGQGAIKKKMIIPTTEAFKDDPLRVYRAGVSASRYDYDIHPQLVTYAKSLVPELVTLAPERVGIELIKALSGVKPRRFFDFLKEAGALGPHFRPIEALIGVKQNAKHHPEGDAYEHTMAVLENGHTGDALKSFVYLVHDLGKSITEAPNHRGHEVAGVDLIEAFGKHLKLPKDMINAGKTGAKLHGKVHLLNKMRSVTIVDLLNEAAKSPLSVVGLADLAKADDLRGSHPFAHMLKPLYTAISAVKGNPCLRQDLIAEDKRVRQARVVDLARAELGL
ncbi:Multifunctional CCA protein [compost metagenome]